MCGIVGFVAERNQALPFLIEGLRRLEYRGYDSAGIALVESGQLHVTKAQGRLSVLEAKLGGAGRAAACGIGHTRWATHGSPTDVNAHPHYDCTGLLATVHNGIIENFQALKAELEAKGHRFRSETDTEVIVHLLEEYGGTDDLVEAVRRAEARLQGAYAFLAVSAREPQRVVAVRRSSPLVVGLGHEENYLASDFSAFLDRTRQAIVLENGDMAVVTPSTVEVTNLRGEPVQRPPLWIDWDMRRAERGGYDHFMLKEIMEQPDVWGDTLMGRIRDTEVVLDSLNFPWHRLSRLRRIQVVAAGTAYHAGLVGKILIERLAQIAVDVDLASEFRYRDPVLDPDETVVIAISQSGETADTLACVRVAQERGLATYAIVNQVGSTLARESDYVAYTQAGPEIAVASTKAYTTQILMLTLLALGLAQTKERARPDLVQRLWELPALGRAWLASDAAVAQLAQRLAERHDVFYIGRGIDYALAMEGQLKIKEIAYIHAEAYAAGELKHGTLALIEPGTPVMAIVTEPGLAEKTVSNILEVQARGAQVWAIAASAIAHVVPCDHQIAVPSPDPLLSPVLAALPLQLLAYWTAVYRGQDVDHPRNLAKSVTVE